MNRETHGVYRKTGKEICAMLMEKVCTAIQEHDLLQKGNHIVVGVSGGPDSICLLSVLKELSEEWKLTLHAVHVNHGIRGEEADGDQAYTESVCEALGVPCHVFQCHIPSLAKEWKMTEEEAGREARFQVFQEVRKEIMARCENNGEPVPEIKIAVAQNMNDQAETVLMRVLRGTGVDGLAGMEYIRDGIIIRPLLDVTRKEIEHYCKERGFQPHIDRTNLETDYTRNKIRLELIPYLEQHFNPGVTRALSRLSRIAAEERNYMDSELPEPKITEEQSRCVFERKAMRELHSAVRKRAIVTGFKAIGLQKDISAVHLEDADRLILEGRTSEMVDFPGGYALRLNYDKVELFRKKQPEEEPELSVVMKMTDGECIPVGRGRIKVSIAFGDAAEKLVKMRDEKRRMVFAMRELLDYGELVLRNRQPGDWIHPSGMSGTKKLQDFFVDAKIPKEERNRIPLICLGSEVLWVVGFRGSENFKATEPRRGVVYLEYYGAI